MPRIIIFLAAFITAIFSSPSAHGDLNLDLSVIDGAHAVSPFNSGKAYILDKNGNSVGRIVYSDPSCDRYTGYNGPTPLIVILDANDYIRKLVLRSNGEPEEIIKKMEASDFMYQWDGYPLSGAIQKTPRIISGAENTCRAIALTLQATLRGLVASPSTGQGTPSAEVPKPHTKPPLPSREPASRLTGRVDQTLPVYPKDGGPWLLPDVGKAVDRLAGNLDPNFPEPVTVPDDSPEKPPTYNGTAQNNKNIRETLEVARKIGFDGPMQKAIETTDPRIWADRINSEPGYRRKVGIILTFLTGLWISLILTYFFSLWCPLSRIIKIPAYFIQQQILLILRMPGGRTYLVIGIISATGGMAATMTFDTVRDVFFEHLAYAFAWYIIIAYLTIILTVILSLLFLGVIKYIPRIYLYLIRIVGVIFVPMIFIICLSLTMNSTWGLFNSNVVDGKYVEAAVKSGQPKTGPPFSSIDHVTKQELVGFATLSELVYKEQQAPTDLPQNVRPLKSVPNVGGGSYNSTTGMLNFDNSDLQVQLFQRAGNSTRKKEIILSFRGTESREDFLTDWRQYFDGKETMQYQTAEKLTGAILRTYPSCRVILTGHSLGGGLAQYAAAMNIKHTTFKGQLKAICFNSAGLSDNALKKISARRLTLVQKHIIQIRSEKDVVSEYGSHIGGFYTLGEGIWAGIARNSIFDQMLFWHNQHSMSSVVEKMKRHL